MPRKLITLIIACMACSLAGIAQDIRFTPLDPPKIEPWFKVVGFAQDTYGYLWFATPYGLEKYDGHQYTAYRHDQANPNSLSSNNVETVYADKDGTIWIGTYGTGFDHFDPVSNQFTNYRHHSGDRNSLASDSVTAFVQDKQGYLWIGTLKGLERFDRGSKKISHYVHSDSDPHSLSNNQVRALLEDKQGVLWVGTGSPFRGQTPPGEGGLNKLDKATGKFTHYMHDDADKRSLTDNMIRALYEDSRGNLWVGTVGPGLQILDRKTGKFERFEYDPKHPEKLSPPKSIDNYEYAPDHVTFITEDAARRIWIGTLDGGINVYNPDTKKVIWFGKEANSKQHLATNQFWCAYRTRDGILWIGTWGEQEVYKISPYESKLPHYHLGETINAFLEDDSGGLWMGTNHGLQLVGNNGKRQLFLADKGDIQSPRNVFDYIVKDDQNQIWLKNSTGLFRFDIATKTFNEYHHVKNHPGSLVSDSVLYLKPGGSGKLWVATRNGLDLMDTKKETFTHFRNDPKDTTSLSFNNIYAIEIDRQNNVWIGTEKGLDKLDQHTGHFKRYLLNFSVNCVLLDSHGNLWAATNDGLLKYNPTTDNFEPYKTGATDIFYIVEDRQGNFWLSTSVGIVKLNVRGQKPVANIYGKNDGVDLSILRTYGTVRRTGAVLFGDTSGYYVFQPDKLLHRTPPPQVVINEFLLGDKAVVPAKNGILTQPVIRTQSIHLKHNENTFSFQFSNIDFVNQDTPAPTSYMLEGYDSQPREAGPDGTASYYNILPGLYKFRVQSQNSDGDSTEKVIEVIISPPWWGTWWAYTIFTVAFAAGIFAFIHFRSLSLLKDKRKLEHEVFVRTMEVMEQKEEISAQRDNLEQALQDLKITQKQLIQSEKMASLGELTAGMAHEIQNPLNFVNNFSEMNIELISEMLEGPVKGLPDTSKNEAGEMLSVINDNMGKILHHGKRADSIIKAMMQQSQASKAARELININTLADEFLKMAYLGQRTKDKLVNIELITKFDESIPEIYAIPQEIGKVLVNLFNNAFYAVTQKQKKAGSGYVPTVEITTCADKKSVTIKVRDNGNGIPASIQNKIMQPFFTTKPTGEGTGLGLFLSYDTIVKGHDGTFSFNTAEGEFTEFVIKLPVRG